MQNEQENAETYAQSQKQRKLERDFRKARLEYAAAKAQGADEQTVKAAQEKLKQADERLDRFEKETGRRRRREREYGPEMRHQGPTPNEQTFKEKARLHTQNPLTVSERGLDAEGFVEKFKGMTGKPEVDASIKESAVEMLKHRGGTDREDLHLIDGDTGEVIHKLTTSDESNSISYDAETQAAIERAHIEGRSIVAIHNHPNGLPPSLDDGSSARAHGYDFGVVVGHNLEVWTYGKTETVIPSELCEQLHSGLQKKYHSMFDFDDKEWYDLLKVAGMEVKRR